jgi:hypothetical protein
LVWDFGVVACIGKGEDGAGIGVGAGAGIGAGVGIRLGVGVRVGVEVELEWREVLVFMILLRICSLSLRCER